MRRAGGEGDNAREEGYADAGLLPDGEGGVEEKEEEGREEVRLEDLQRLIVAEDEAVREQCMVAMEQRHSVWSQLNMDVFIFHNFVKAHAGRGQGVYVDVGAYEPLEISNTAFFDLCLGWKGLCIDMLGNSDTLDAFAAQRSCRFVKECVSDVATHKVIDQSFGEWVW